MKKKIIIVLVVMAIMGGIGLTVAYFMWNTPHADIEAVNTDFKTDAAALVAEFTSGAAAAEKKYSGKVLEFTGEVTKVVPGDSLTSVQLKGNETYGLMCEMLAGSGDVAKQMEVGKKVSIKAFYQGFIEGEADFGMPGDILFKKGVVVE